jgi:hypothetical protein
MELTKRITVVREIEFDITVTLERDYDDDGCGSPSTSGNSMTGRRGRGYWIATDFVIDTKSLIEGANSALFMDDEDIQSAADADEEDDD